MKYIPNILSIFRILLVPIFVWRVLIGDTKTAAILLIVSGLTDLLDGFLARRFGWITSLGKVLDPAADKLTQIAVSVLFLWRYPQYWFLFAFLIFKELLMIVLSGILITRGKQIEGAKFIGKLSTMVFYFSMTLILLIPSMPQPLKLALLIGSTITAFIAAVLYVPEFQRYLRE